MFCKEIQEQTGPESAFLEHLEAQTLKIVTLSANCGGAFVGSMYIPALPKKILDMSLAGLLHHV